VERVVLNALALNAALTPDICAVRDSVAIVFGEADPPVHRNILARAGNES
jgi:hypothetical protein